MNTLPALPSSLQNVSLPATVMGVDEKALTTATSLALKLDGPGFKAREVIPATDAEERKEYAINLLDDTGFNALWLANFARNINLDTTPLEEVLAKTRAMDFGAVGDLSVQAAMYMNRMGKLPEPPNQRFMELMQAGKAKAEDMIKMAKTLNYEIEKWFRMHDDNLQPFTDVKVRLYGQFTDMTTQIVLTQELAENEDERTLELTLNTALMEFVLLAMPGKIKQLQESQKTADDKVAEQRKIDRLTGLSPLVLKAINTLNPLIFTGNAAVDKYLQLSNMAGGRALILGLFLSACIARWESDIVTEILTLQQLAAGLSLAKVEQFMNQQGERTSEGMIEASKQYVNLMNCWSVTLEHMQKVLDDTEETKEILASGFKELVVQHGQTTSAVENAKERIDKSKTKFNEEMQAAAANASV
jgi:hypothetical protein